MDFGLDHGVHNSVTSNDELNKRFFDQSKYFASGADFNKIPGSPIAYWTNDEVYSVFKQSEPLSKYADIGKGLDTGDNNRFLRQWHEVDNSSKKWITCQKGGPYRKWYGNNDIVINWGENGKELKSFSGSNLRNSHNYFKSGITWTRVSIRSTAFRFFSEGNIFESTGPCLFPVGLPLFSLIAFLNSVLTLDFLKIMSPTLDFQSGHISGLPVLPIDWANKKIIESAKECIEIAKQDWDFYETSNNFVQHPMINTTNRKSTLENTYLEIHKSCLKMTKKMKEIEEGINQFFLDQYKLKKFSYSVQPDQITLNCNPHYRYGVKKDKEERKKLYLIDTLNELISYSVGCMMGRYSLGEPGLIYANSGNEGFDKSKYKRFKVDDDGIITLTDIEELVIRDDLTDRFEEFVCTEWGEETLAQNLKFVADTLGAKNNELPKETIRRWISAEFFKDHLQRYKNRPIYWLFSSGKKKAFEALVYLHRYNEGTLSRMRMKYVVPLQSRISDRLKTIEDDIATASGQERTRLTRLKKVLADKEIELREYDETLRHLAEKQIKLDLDDGVKVNYGKFPGLLAETKKVCGK